MDQSLIHVYVGAETDKPKCSFWLTWSSLAGPSSNGGDGEAEQKPQSHYPWASLTFISTDIKRDLKNKKEREKGKTSKYAI